MPTALRGHGNNSRLAFAYRLKLGDMANNRKQCQRINEPGHAHCLTFSCFRRQRWLVTDQIYQWITDAINRAGEKHQLDVWAYVIMPEHVHLLFLPRTPDYSISKVLTTLKQSVSNKVLNRVRQERPEFLQKMADVQPNGQVSYRFWQRGGGYDRNLYKSKSIQAEIEYIHANPVRRKLCERPTDWIWSSAREHAEIETGPVRLDLKTIPE